MKQSNNTFVKKTALTLLTVLILATTAMGQSVRSAKHTFNETAIKNLMVGLNSENEGLRKSSIYFAGLYGIEEAAGTLVDQFPEEKNPKLRILIALALYRIGDQKGMDAIFTASKKDGDQEVKRICSAIADEYNTSSTVVSLNN
jgi:HEAT repeat protein